ncbi:MAG: SDR family oxidoreductase [Microbacteriaceae bacterium]|nr:SDR family oxidoreductase [Microbacteriaceae bacterium]MCL2796044.1 SDR family oxidoreductase [Microbacteriaceae bacterium]
MEQPDFSIAGQRALVTGASRGIGRDLALALALAGAEVLAGVRAEADAAELVAEAAGRGASVAPFILDVTDVAATRAAIDAEVAARGPIQVLVNNAGLGFNHDAVDVGEADWDAMMDVNLKGLFFTTQAVARHMLAAGYGRVVNLSSQGGLVGIRRHAVYSASKGGVNLLTKVLALEWAEQGVTVNAVAPTYIYTPGTAERLDQPEIASDILARIPAGRFGTTTDVAGAVLYFASPAAGLVTGTVLPIDGGWTAQ